MTVIGTITVAARKTTREATIITAAVGITTSLAHLYYANVLAPKNRLLSGSVQFLSATALCAVGFHCLPLGKLLRDNIDDKELNAPHAAIAPFALVTAACLFYRSVPHLKTAKRVAQFIILNFGATSFFFAPFMTPLMKRIFYYFRGKPQQEELNIKKVALGILGYIVIFTSLLKPYKLRTPYSPAKFQTRIFYLVTLIPFYYSLGKSLEFYQQLRNS